MRRQRFLSLNELYQRLRSPLADLPPPVNKRPGCYTSARAEMSLPCLRYRNGTSNTPSGRWCGSGVNYFVDISGHDYSMLCLASTVFLAGFVAADFSVDFFAAARKFSGFVVSIPMTLR